MKPHRRDKLDRRIGRALKAGLLHERPPLVSRYLLLRSAADAWGARALTVGRGSRPGWSAASLERHRPGVLHALEGRKYSYLVITATFRLAW